jgi:hypothetical protein
MASGRAIIERIVIEAETPGDSRTMFRVRMDDLALGENLTATQAHLIVGEVLDRITCRGRRRNSQGRHSLLRPRASRASAARRVVRNECASGAFWSSNSRTPDRR